jgi:hypothetical protein
MRIHDCLDNSQSESRPTHTAGTRFVHSVKALKYMRQALGWDTDAGIFKHQHHLPSLSSSVTATLPPLSV